MSKTVRMVLLGATLALMTLSASAPQERPHMTADPEWLKSGNPCWPTERQKKQWKAVTGSEASHLKCYPVRVNMTWDFEEIFHHHGGLGDDRFLVTLWESFGGYFQVTHDPQKRDRVLDYFIFGPAPCCPGKVDFLTTRLHASILGSAPKGFSGSIFKFFEADAGQIVPSSINPGSFGLKWGRDGLDNLIEMGGPNFHFIGKFMEKPFQWAFSPTVMQTDNYRVRELGHSPSWDEIRPFFEKQEVWQKESPLENVMDLAILNESYELHGKVTAQVDFAEQQTEEWLISVTGRERDPLGTSLEYKAPGKSVKSLPLNVDFDWLLEGKFTIKKRKGVRSFENGVIDKADQTPRLLFDAPDLFRCDFTACGGNKPSLAGFALFGKLQGQTVNVQWPASSAEACVVCIPKGSSGNKVAIRKKFGTSEFAKRISQEWIPLRDGAVKSGGVQDWMTYRITLTKLS
jgi:hypothetical protein